MVWTQTMIMARVQRLMGLGNTPKPMHWAHTQYLLGSGVELEPNRLGMPIVPLGSNTSHVLEPKYISKCSWAWHMSWLLLSLTLWFESNTFLVEMFFLIKS